MFNENGISISVTNNYHDSLNKSILFLYNNPEIINIMGDNV